MKDKKNKKLKELGFTNKVFLFLGICFLFCSILSGHEETLWYYLSLINLAALNVCLYTKDKLVEKKVNKTDKNKKLMTIHLRKK